MEVEMSRNTKIVLGIVGGLLVICCLGVVIAVAFIPDMLANFADNAFTEDAEEATVSFFIESME
jgi:uncharacterized membrane protein SpoIIM required for sporulation